MSPDPEKVEAIRQWEAPRDKAGVKSFLQTAQFCSIYMKGEGGETYSDLTKPLRVLTRYGVHFKWDKQCQESLRKIKEALMGNKVMAAYDPRKPPGYMWTMALRV